MMETAEKAAAVVSRLNPNAPLFVPAAYRVPEDFSSEWWTLMETSPTFRECWVSERFAGSDEQVQFAEDLEELVDLEEFLEYQEQLQREDASQEFLDLDVDYDIFSDDEISSLNVNACKELTKVQKLQSHWCKPLKNHDKLPNNYVNLPRKAHMYRIQQPRTVM